MHEDVIITTPITSTYRATFPVICVFLIQLAKYYFTGDFNKCIKTLLTAYCVQFYSNADEPE